MPTANEFASVALKDINIAQVNGIFEGWAFQAKYHWLVSFKNIVGKEYRTYFHTNRSEKSRHYPYNLIPVKPKINEVLECLASDCRAIESSPLYPDFCDDLGYDKNEISSRKVYDESVKEYVELRSFFRGNFSDFLSISDG